MLCDKLLLGSGVLGDERVTPPAVKGGRGTAPTASSGQPTGGMLGLYLGEGPAILGLNKLRLLKEVRGYGDREGRGEKRGWKPGDRGWIVPPPLPSDRAKQAGVLKPQP